MMRAYELMVILDPEIDERTVAPSLDKFLNVIRTDGGTVEKDVRAVGILAFHRHFIITFFRCGYGQNGQRQAGQTDDSACSAMMAVD